MTKKVTAIFSASTATLAGLLCISISTPVLALTDCSLLKACEKKFCEIEGQINIAQEKNNARQVTGLTKALAEAKQYCTAEGLKEDLVEKTKEAKEELAEYEIEFKEAQNDGKTDKIRKYQEKMAEEKIKIKRLEDELSNLDNI